MRTSTKLNLILAEHELRVKKPLQGIIEVTVINEDTGDAFIVEAQNWSTVISRAFADLKKQGKKKY